MLGDEKRKGTYVSTRTTMSNASRLISYALIISCFVLSIIWFFLFSGFWTISVFDVSGTQTLSRGEVVSSTEEVLRGIGWGPIGRGNYFFIDTDQIADRLEESLFLENVVVDKSYPNILRLKLVERQRSVILASKDQLLSIDTSGLVTGDVSGDISDIARKQMSGTKIAESMMPPVVWCELQELAAPGYSIAKPMIIKTWLDMYEALISSGLKFRYIGLMSPESKVAKIKMEKGYDVILDLATPIQPQLQTYIKYVQTQGKSLNIPEYIDVRVPGKTFSK